MYKDRIFLFGNRFINRMDTGLLEAALQYVDFDEAGLAFETLCDHICEYDILISQEEYVEAIDLALDMEFDINMARYTCMKALIR
ncbi:MafI family immunity protein [Achromobacter sp. 413638]|uniref:MafI family immunity protein n=1 Tax=Achromobacter sp. 413638 TaxID=3342385 RepID=UPI00370C7F1A